jgi:hypothetical protein
MKTRPGHQLAWPVPAGSFACWARRSNFPSAGLSRVCRRGQPQEALSPLLLEVQGAGWLWLEAADAPAQLGDLGAHPGIGQHADAEGQRHRADVVAAFDR